MKYSGPITSDGSFLVRMGSLLIVCGMLASQVGLNFFHNHRNTAEETARIVSVHAGDSTVPCSICALGVTASYFVDGFILSVPGANPVEFQGMQAMATPLVPSAAASGRAPPAQ
ncbi:MAG: hypothetical protein SH819_01385 [Cytophagales bacterium]|nr:hypothetical protein [Cytophagales bacterium]